MKKKNAKCEFASERSEFLLKNFRQAIAEASQISARKIFGQVANLPAPRFWVSEIRAYRVVLDLIKGEDATDGMHPLKREMYLEIFKRVMEKRLSEPQRSLGDLVFEVVNSPAPKQYISWQWTGKLINQHKKRKKNFNKFNGKK